MATGRDRAWFDVGLARLSLAVIVGAALFVGGPDRHRGRWRTRRASTSTPTCPSVAWVCPRPRPGPDGRHVGRRPIGTSSPIAASGATTASYTMPTTLRDITAGPDGTSVGGFVSRWRTSIVSTDVGHGWRPPSRSRPSIRFAEPGFTGAVTDLLAGPDGNVWYARGGLRAIGPRHSPSASVTEFAVPAPSRGSSSRRPSLPGPMAPCGSPTAEQRHRSHVPSRGRSPSSPSAPRVHGRRPRGRSRRQCLVHRAVSGTSGASRPSGASPCSRCRPRHPRVPVPARTPPVPAVQITVGPTPTSGSGGDHGIWRVTPGGLGHRVRPRRRPRRHGRSPPAPTAVCGSARSGRQLGPGHRRHHHRRPAPTASSRR